MPTLAQLQANLAALQAALVVINAQTPITADNLRCGLLLMKQIAALNAQIAALPPTT